MNSNFRSLHNGRTCHKSVKFDYIRLWSTIKWAKIECWRRFQKMADNTYSRPSTVYCLRHRLTVVVYFRPRENAIIPSPLDWLCCWILIEVKPSHLRVWLSRKRVKRSKAPTNISNQLYNPRPQWHTHTHRVDCKWNIKIFLVENKCQFHFGALWTLTRLVKLEGSEEANIYRHI